ncbi:hypothetical protein ES703_30321 [subsurface metagenome]
MAFQGTDNFSQAYFFGPVGRAGRGEIHKIDTGYEEDEQSNQGENIYILYGT